MVGNSKNVQRSGHRLVAGKMSQCRKVATEDKENANGRPKASRIPKPVNRSRARTPLCSNNAPRSQVRPVPDFNKLHSSFQQKLEKAKSSNRSVTEFKTFQLTPSSKNTAQHSRPESADGNKRERRGRREGRHKKCVGAAQEGVQAVSQEAKNMSSDIRPDCQQAYLPAQVKPHTPSLMTGRSQQLWGMDGSPRQQIRQSVYSRTERALQKMLQSNVSGSSVPIATHSVSRGNTFSQLLQEMVQSTASSMRTVSRLGEGEEHGGELEGVKMRLESQLEAVEESPATPPPHPPATPPPHPPWTHHSPSHLTKPHTLHPHPLNHAPSLSHIYQEETELCVIVWGSDGVCDGPRPHCPVAHQLEHCYMTSVAKF